VRGAPPSEFKITDPEAHIALMAIGGLMIQFVMILIISAINKFKLTKCQGYIQIGYFVTLISIISVGAFTFAR